MSETPGTPQARASQGTYTTAPRSIKAREASDYPLEEFIESRGFRPEIQGLRAFAVLLVVLYHVWFGKVSGGVDVFLFISAFLLSLSFMRKINEGKPLNLFSYWMHVFQRLLPVATVVIAGTTIASFFVLAPSRWAQTVTDAKSSLFYFQNWNLAFSSVDYYAQNASVKSPFQHFWSLSIQGQIFIIWPLLFAAVAYVVHRFRGNLFTTAVFIFNTVFVASLTFSIVETDTNQGFAYFDTRTRLWEFAIGTLLAMLTLKWKAPEKARVVMGWVGIIGLVTCGAILPVERAFPGYLALWPVISGALVIMAGRTNSRWGIDRLLVSAPLQNLGNISYALYLVHWSILILYSSAVGTSRVNVIEGTIIILVSIGLAWLLIRFVEKPLRYRKDPFVPWLMMKMRFKTIFSVKTWADQLAFILAIFLVAGVPLAAAQTWIGYRNTQSEQNAELQVQTASENYPGARAIGGAQQGLIDNPIPSGGDVKAQYEGLSDPCTGVFAPSDPALAKYCNVQKYGPEDAPLTMVIGNSHAEQALSIFKPIAEQTKTNLQTYLLGGCQYPVRSVNAGNECSEFNTKMTEEIIKRKPQTVVFIATIAQARSNDERADPSLDETVRRLTEAGIQVIGLRDNPRFEYNIYECAQKAGADKSSCARPASDKYAAENPAKEIFDKYRNQGAVMVDLKDVYCPDGMCSPVVGNIYVYFDDNHVSKTYGRTMAQTVFQRAAEGGWLVSGKVNF